MTDGSEAINIYVDFANNRKSNEFNPNVILVQELEQFVSSLSTIDVGDEIFADDRGGGSSGGSGGVVEKGGGSGAIRNSGAPDPPVKTQAATTVASGSGGVRGDAKANPVPTVVNQPSAHISRSLPPRPSTIMVPPGALLTVLPTATATNAPTTSVTLNNTSATQATTTQTPTPTPKYVGNTAEPPQNPTSPRHSVPPTIEPRRGTLRAATSKIGTIRSNATAYSTVNRDATPEALVSCNVPVETLPTTVPSSFTPPPASTFAQTPLPVAIPDTILAITSTPTIPTTPAPALPVPTAPAPTPPVPTVPPLPAPTPPPPTSIGFNPFSTIVNEEAVQRNETAIITNPAQLILNILECTQSMGVDSASVKLTFSLHSVGDLRCITEMFVTNCNEHSARRAVFKNLQFMDIGPSVVLVCNIIKEERTPERVHRRWCGVSTTSTLCKGDQFLSFSPCPLRERQNTPPLPGIMVSVKIRLNIFEGTYSDLCQNNLSSKEIPSFNITRETTPDFTRNDLYFILRAPELKSNPFGKKWEIFCTATLRDENGQQLQNCHFTHEHSRQVYSTPLWTLGKQAPFDEQVRINIPLNHLSPVYLYLTLSKSKPGSSPLCYGAISLLSSGRLLSVKEGLHKIFLWRTPPLGSVIPLPPFNEKKDTTIGSMGVQFQTFLPVPTDETVSIVCSWSKRGCLADLTSKIELVSYNAAQVEILKFLPPILTQLFYVLDEVEWNHNREPALQSYYALTVILDLFNKRNKKFLIYRCYLDRFIEHYFKFGNAHRNLFKCLIYVLENTSEKSRLVQTLKVLPAIIQFILVSRKSYDEINDTHGDGEFLHQIEECLKLLNSKIKENDNIASAVAQEYDVLLQVLHDIFNHEKLCTIFLDFLGTVPFNKGKQILNKHVIDLVMRVLGDTVKLDEELPRLIPEIFKLITPQILECAQLLKEVISVVYCHCVLNGITCSPVVSTSLSDFFPHFVNEIEPLFAVKANKSPKSNNDLPNFALCLLSVVKINQHLINNPTWNTSTFQKLFNVMCVILQCSWLKPNLRDFAKGVISTTVCSLQAQLLAKAALFTGSDQSEILLWLNFFRLCLTLFAETHEMGIRNLINQIWEILPSKHSFAPLIQNLLSLLPILIGDGVINLIFSDLCIAEYKLTGAFCQCEAETTAVIESALRKRICTINELRCFVQMLRERLSAQHLDSLFSDNIEVLVKNITSVIEHRNPEMLKETCLKNFFQNEEAYIAKLQVFCLTHTVSGDESVNKVTRLLNFHLSFKNHFVTSVGLDWPEFMKIVPEYAEFFSGHMISDHTDTFHVVFMKLYELQDFLSQLLMCTEPSNPDLPFIQNAHTQLLTTTKDLLRQRFAELISKTDGLPRKFLTAKRTLQLDVKVQSYNQVSGALTPMHLLVFSDVAVITEAAGKRFYLKAFIPFEEIHTVELPRTLTLQCAFEIKKICREEQERMDFVFCTPSDQTKSLVLRLITEGGKTCEQDIYKEYDTRKSILSHWFEKTSSAYISFLKELVLPIHTFTEQITCSLTCGKIVSKQFLSETTYDSVHVIPLEIGLIIQVKSKVVEFIPLTAQSKLSEQESDVVISIPENGRTFWFQNILPCSPARFINELHDVAIRCSSNFSALISVSTTLFNSRCILGTVQLQKPVGKGGFAEVWQGATADGTPVAAKKLYDYRFLESDARKEFLREALLLHDLSGEPGILKFMGVCLNPPREKGIWMVTEWCSCGSLDKIIFSEPYRQALDLKKSLNILKNVCSALVTLHKRMIIHRDLKPENILLRNLDTWDVRICDLGLSRFAQRNKTLSQDNTPKLTGHICGTFGYAAPELFEQHHDHKVDVFAWALIMREVLSGTRTTDILTVPKQEWSARPREVMATLMPVEWPLVLRRLILQCCSYYPALRPSFQECYRTIVALQQTLGFC
ncbi:Serine/threonine kinase [Pelomyxa schiedti]|nr:Serine/threonine kinase [Pelomyxa schiedti]